MSKYTRNPFSFDGCHICTVSRQAESKGIALNEKELIQAFKVQAAQSKTANSRNAKKHAQAKK